MRRIFSTLSSGSNPRPKRAANRYRIFFQNRSARVQTVPDVVAVEDVTANPERVQGDGPQGLQRCFYHCLKAP